MVDILLLNPYKNQIYKSMLRIKNAIDFCTKSYENKYTKEPNNYIKEPTCYKIPGKPTCIDLIFTNSLKQFRATLTLKTILSDFHKMTMALFKSEFPHQKPKMIFYQNYNHFDRNSFEKEFKNTLIIQKTLPKYSFSF